MTTMESRRSLVVTIFTDASFHDRTGAAGWSAWIKFGSGRGETWRESGQFQGEPKSSEAAELAAIANALHIVTARLGARAGDIVILQTDCKNAIEIINHKPRRKPICGYKKTVLDFIDGTRSRAGFTLDLRYVPAHRNGIDRRSHVNEWCDAAAKLQMRAMRRERTKSVIEKASAA